jgi:hypothetical protein
VPVFGLYSRLGSDFESEAPGSLAFELLPNPGRATVFTEEDAITFGGSSTAFLGCLRSLSSWLRRRGMSP